MNNFPIAVGGANGGDLGWNKAVEVLRGDSWIYVGDFPFVEDFIYDYSMVTYNKELYIFGMVP